MRKSRILNFMVKNKWLIILLTVHVFGILFFYGAIDFFNQNPIYNYDYPYHLYYCYEAQHYYSEYHSWGYNPFFKAGSPSGIILDNELFKLICSLFSFQHQIIFIKIWVVLILCLLPVLMYYSSLNFGLGKNTGVVSILVLLVYLYNDYFTNSVVSYGMFNFLFGSILSVFYLSLFFRYIFKKERRIIIFLFVTFPFMFLVHLSSVIIFFIPFLLMYFFYIKKLTLRDNLLIIALILIALFIIIFWIILPFLAHFKPYLEDSNQYFQIKSFKQVITDFYYSSGGYNSGVQYIKSSIIILGFLGMFRGGYKNRLFFIFLITTLILFVITYLHNLVSILNFLSNIQPYKFIIPSLFFLIVPCSDVIVRVYKKIKFNKVNKLKIIFYIMFVLFIIFQIINVQVFNQPIEHKLSTETPDNYQNLIKWIKENTTNRGRVLFEMGISARKMFNIPSVLYGLISFETNREILGGLHWESSLKHNFPSITANEIFGKGLNIKDEKLMEYLKLYNVGWIIVQSPVLKSNLDKRSLFKKVTKIGNLNIYETGMNLSFLIGGEGVVTSDFNKIKIKSLQTQEDDVILKYHWQPTLNADNVSLSRVFLLDDPIGFIRIEKDKDINSVKIYNNYDSKEE